MLSFCLTTPSLAAKKPENRTYDFAAQDQKEEQAKFLVKLKEDKRKIDLAIGNTRQLIDKSKSMPYLPELYLRLAELYIEKSRFVFFIRKSETHASSKALNNLESQTLKTKAIETYQQIINDFPDYEELDKVHFFMAHEYRELNQIPEMIAQYRIILKKYPSSIYVPECYLLLGDHFQSEQKIGVALRHYKKVLDYPASSAIVIARYKLAWVHVSKGELKDAIKLFELSVVSNQANKKANVDTYKRVDIKLESLVDMAFCYPDAYKKSTPSEAIAYFHKYAWSRQVFTHVLEKLGNRYLARKKYTHAVEVYRELSTLQHDEEKLLAYARHIFECVSETKNFQNADQDIAYIVGALKSQKYSIHIDPETKKKNLKDFELYARDIATRLHKKAKKSRSSQDFKKTAGAYKLYLDFFDTGPVSHKIRKNYAEALFSSKQYLEAGKQYEKLLTNEQTKGSKTMPTPQGQLRKKTMNSAIVAYYNALKHREELNNYETAYARNGLATNGNQFVSEFPKASNIPDIIFNVAWIAYDEGKYDETIASFSDFIKKYPKGKATESAISLVLDAYHQKEDYKGLVSFGRKVLNTTAIDGKARKEVATIVQASESKLVSLMTVKALNNWEEGKHEIEALAENNPSTGLGEQALNALILSSSDKGQLETVLSAGNKLITSYPSSTYIPGVMALMIDSAADASQLRLVAKYLETFTHHAPKHEKSAGFIRQAAQIRQAMGQYKKANQNYTLFLQLSKPWDQGRAHAMFTIFENSKTPKDKNRAVGVLKAGLKEMTVIQGIRAESLLAERYREKGHYKTARRYRKSAYKKYKRDYGKQSPEMNQAYAAMVFNAMGNLHRQYMALKLKKTIDNRVVSKKSKRLKKLEEGYHEVIGYQSPEYVLKACSALGEINFEFARFLMESPLPKLSAQQKKEYKKILLTKAKEYSEKSETYRNTVIKQAHKWEICDADLIAYYDAKHKGMEAFGGISSTVEITDQFLSDPELKQLHLALAQDTGNPGLTLHISDAYFARSDYYHAKVTAQQLLESSSAEKSAQARAWENIGISNLYLGHDALSKNAFEKALSLDPDRISVKVNLAGILNHYRHKKKAAALYGQLPRKPKLDTFGPMIHPVAKERYRDFIHHKKG